jgi:Flp pilus assembly protein TadG
MTFSRSRRTPQRRGLATVWFAIVGLVLVGLFSLTIDTARVRYVHHQLQAAADAAALAGAQFVETDQSRARKAAVATALANTADKKFVQIRSNDGNDADGDVVVGVFDSKSRVFTATTRNPNAIKVNARRTSDSPGGALNLIFGAFWKTASSEVTGTAIAMAPAPGPAGIVLLDPAAAPELALTSDAKLSVIGGTIQINSNAGNALSVTGNGSISADAINVVGSMVQTGSSSVGKVNTGAPSVADPLGNLGVLTKADAKEQPMPTQTTGSGTVTLPAGYYPSIVSFSGNLKVQLKGTYIFAHGLELTGNTSLDASAGALLYAVDGPITLTGSGGVQLTTLQDGTQYGDVGIYMDRNNYSDVTLSGDGGAQVGTVYAPSSRVVLTDKSKISELGIVTLVAARAAITGSGSITVSASPGGGAGNGTSLVN